MKIEFFDSINIEEIIWPDNDNGQYAKDYFLPMMKEGTKKYISNIDAHIFILKINEQILPVIKSDPHLKNCYVCSPYDQYIEYAIAELKTLNAPPLEFLLKYLLKSLGLFFRLSSFNHVVYINNWFLSTNLYPELNFEELRQINDFVSKKFPNDIIIYRSLNRLTNSNLMDDLKALGGKEILSRQVYLTDPKNPTYKSHSNFKKDVFHLENSPLMIRDSSHIKSSDIEAILLRYNNLYIEKYTDLNPQFTYDYIKNGIDHHLFHFKLVENKGNIIAALGYFRRNGVMTTPILGFDTKAPKDHGLYRLLTMLLTRESERNQDILNRSAGAASFKSKRGAIPYIEYNYYFDENAKLLQKTSWAMLRLLLNSFGIRLLQFFKL